MKMPPLDTVVCIHLLDHDHSDEDVVYDVLVYGRVVKKTRTTLVIDVWHPEDPNHDREKFKDKNALDSYSLVRSAIVAWWPLKRGKRVPDED
jgi:hypothetical protein